MPFITNKFSVVSNDLDVTVQITREMCQLVTTHLGSDLWVMLSRAKAHRSMLKNAAKQELAKK